VETPSQLVSPSEREPLNAFIYLVTGLYTYLEADRAYSSQFAPRAQHDRPRQTERLSQNAARLCASGSSAAARLVSSQAAGLVRCGISYDKLKHLLAVVRLRMNAETPQYVTADDYASEDEMRDLMHRTSYVDVSGKLLHYFSIAGLPETQKQQHGKDVREAFRGDAKGEYDDIAFKHPQLVEMVPFFVRADFDSHAERLQLCRCLHLLRISPAFVMGDILLPYPMHLGEALIKDQLCILNSED
jgi:hypothetical protein